MNDAVHTTMTLIGVSHAASEFVVMRTQMYGWIKHNFIAEIRLIPQNQWSR